MSDSFSDYINDLLLRIDSQEEMIQSFRKEMKPIADLMTEAAMLLTSLNSHHGRHDVIANLLKEAQRLNDKA